MPENFILPTFAQNAINLASPRLGAKVIFATDEFFAPKERMLDDTPAVFYLMNMTTMENGWMAGNHAVDAIVVMIFV